MAYALGNEMMFRKRYVHLCGLNNVHGRLCAIGGNPNLPKMLIPNTVW